LHVKIPVLFQAPETLLHGQITPINDGGRRGRRILQQPRLCIRPEVSWMPLPTSPYRTTVTKNQTEVSERTTGGDVPDILNGPGFCNNLETNHHGPAFRYGAVLCRERIILQSAMQFRMTLQRSPAHRDGRRV